MLQGSLSTVSRRHVPNHSLVPAGSLDASSPSGSIRLVSRLDHARERHHASLNSRAPVYDRVAMDDLEDELDLRFHKGLNPDVYYRCPTSEVI